MSSPALGPVRAVAKLLEDANVPYALIGGHAVNQWLEPRFTADIDLTVAAAPAAQERLERAFTVAGYVIDFERDEKQPSGPDIVGWTSPSGDLVELQIAKTELQRDVIRRAVATEEGTRVATKEDLIVMKLIADRAKDRLDLIGLSELPDVDWAHVERWASEWDVMDRLRRYKPR